MNRPKILTAIISSFALLVCVFCWLAGSTSAMQERGQGVKIKVERNQEIDLYAESHALVIGVSEYNNGWKKLPGTKRDVTDVSAALRKQGFEVENLLDPTRSQLDERLRTFISEHGLAERNRLLVYFAGHGFTEKVADGRQLGYIVPVDAPLPERNPSQFSARAISMEEMEAQASRIKSKHALFVFDSCFSGTLFETMRSTRTVPPAIESKTAAPVRFFITAGTYGQEVPDESIFRAWFVRALEGEGDLNGDGFITGEELGMFLSGRVSRESREAQTPRYGKIRDARLNIGDFVFVSPKRERPSSVELISSITVDPLAEEIGKIEQAAQGFAAQFRQAPLNATMYKDQVQNLVNRLNNDPRCERKAPHVAALVYRLYAATLLMPAMGADPFKQLDAAYPWVQRSIGQGNYFKDSAELRKAGAAIKKIIEQQPRSLPFKELLWPWVRVAMVDASEPEFKARLCEATEMFDAIINVVHGKQSALGEREKAALELGFALGGKLILVSLPLEHRKESYAGVTYSANDLILQARKLGITQSQAKNMANTVQAALGNVNTVTPANTVAGELNRLKETLEASCEYRLMRTLRIGFVLGVCMEAASIALTLGPKDENVGSIMVTMDKFKVTLAEDVPLSGLPTNARNAIQVATAQVKSVAELKGMVESCKKVLLIAKSRL